MPKLSVIMSVYNETEEDIIKSIESIKNQTFSDFEFLIIIDDPQRESLKSALESMDSRIRVYVNEENIGLALSMNKAASLSAGKYLARMDADDISLIERFEKEVCILDSNRFDFVCTGYTLINEDDIEIGVFSPHYSDEEVVKLLPYDNTIHHPTVMFSKRVFDKVGGYRNFPCSQDYDLWLRMVEHGVKVHYIDEVLFKYRIRQQSISEKNKVKQITTWWYIQELYRQRKKEGNDSFSVDNYNEYLLKQKVYDKKYCQDAAKARRLKTKVDVMKKSSKNRYARPFLIFAIMLKSKFYRKYYFHMINYKFHKKGHYNEKNN